ncbi:hypothetical protein B296_00007812 [Ensete ventricosum]|uniref:Uncharacterized protein n=1 Tax=Ensete ventricosum TaxID=4639 RepID=A0A426ZY23_ENSVE|nr:hypothetical protein B296_00007812 [Ensete ventricosum]
MADPTTPLLEPSKEAFFHENCPGCKQDRRNQLRLGIPFREFFFIWIVALCSGTTQPPFGTHLLSFSCVLRSVFGLIVDTSWAMGLIFGPAIGGFLAQVIYFYEILNINKNRRRWPYCPLL